MPSADMIELAERVISDHLKAQCQRLIDAGYPNAQISGNFGTAPHEDKPANATIWCNVRVHGMGPGYWYDRVRTCSFADLEKIITGALGEAPIENKRATFARKSGLAIGYLKSAAEIDQIDMAFRGILEPRVYEMLSQNYRAQGGEAEGGDTAGGSVHEHPTPTGDAPESSDSPGQSAAHRGG